MITHWLTVEQAQRLVGRTQRTLQVWAARGWIDRQVGADGRVQYGHRSVLDACLSRELARRVSRRPGPGRGNYLPEGMDSLWDENNVSPQGGEWEIEG